MIVSNHFLNIDKDGRRRTVKISFREKIVANCFGGLDLEIWWSGRMEELDLKFPWVLVLLPTKRTNN